MIHDEFYWLVYFMDAASQSLLGCFQRYFISHPLPCISERHIQSCISCVQLHHRIFFVLIPSSMRRSKLITVLPFIAPVVIRIKVYFSTSTYQTFALVFLPPHSTYTIQSCNVSLQIHECYHTNFEDHIRPMSKLPRQSK